MWLVSGFYTSHLKMRWKCKQKWLFEQVTNHSGFSHKSDCDEMGPLWRIIHIVNIRMDKRGQCTLLYELFAMPMVCMELLLVILRHEIVCIEPIWTFIAQLPIIATSGRSTLCKWRCCWRKWRCVLLIIAGGYNFIYFWWRFFSRRRFCCRRLTFRWCESISSMLSTAIAVARFGRGATKIRRIVFGKSNYLLHMHVRRLF